MRCSTNIPINLNASESLSGKDEPEPSRLLPSSNDDGVLGGSKLRALNLNWRLNMSTKEAYEQQLQGKLDYSDTEKSANSTR
jgi:hypothetical protein